ncbi:MAG: hypothetical protein ACLP7Q_23160 [Isosphaeraceae bacterium]
MPQQTNETGSVRPERRFRPGAEETQPGLGSTSQLEARMLLSHSAHRVEVAAQARPSAHPARVTPANEINAASAHPARVTPANEINAAYAAFVVDFFNIEQQYIESINSNSTGTTTVTANLTQNYTAGTSTMVVDNATVFGPDGTFTTPVIATVSINGVSTGSAFVITGRAGNNTLIINPGQSSAVSLTPPAALTGTVTTTSQSSAAGIFPSYIVNRTNQMAIELVQYFNSLPLRLPFLNAPPHTPNNRGAIQTFVYDSIVGGSSSAMSLQASLSAIPLPTTTGNDLQIYNATVSSAIEQSRIQTLNGVSEVYAKSLYISAPSPNNRFGVVAPKSIPTYYTSG